MTLTKYDASAIAIHRMSAATQTGEYQVYLAADVDAALDTSMRTQETLAKNVNDGLLEIRELRAEVERLTALSTIDKQANDEYREIRAANLAVIHDLTQQLATALRAVWEEAAKVAESWIGEMDHDDQTCRCIAIDLRAQAKGKP